MILRLLITIFCAVLFSSGCYLPINGRVVDARTQQPIEGAIVLVEWTKKHGFGDAWTESYKVVETVSDKDGIVNIAGCYSPFVEKPAVTVYKKGYVAWNDENIFPGWAKRTDFRWGNYVFKLERFKEEYSYTDHQMFTSRAINDTIGWENKKTFIKNYENAERDMIIKEQNKKDQSKMRSPLR